MYDVTIKPKYVFKTMESHNNISFKDEENMILFLSCFCYSQECNGMYSSIETKLELKLCPAMKRRKYYITIYYHFLLPSFYICAV